MSAAGKIRLIGAVGIKVRPDASDFKSELRSQINNLPQYEVEVNVDADTALFEKEVRDAKKRAEGDKVNLRVGLDYDGVQRAKAQLEGIRKSLDKFNTEIPVELNVKGVAKAKSQLAALQKTVDVEVKFTRDEAGYQSILNRIDRIRRDKLTKTINFKTDAKSLRDEERKAKAALAAIDAKKTIDIRYDNNWDGINKAIDSVDRRLADLRQLKIKTKLDKASLEEARGKLEKKLATATVTMKYNEDEAGYQAVLDRIRQIQRQKLQQTIKFKTDDEALKAEAEKFEKLLADSKPKRTVEITYTNDRSSLESAISKIDDELKKLSEVTLPPITADTDSLLDARNKLQTMLDAEPVTMKINEDKAGFQSVLDKIRKIKAQRAEIPVSFLTDDASLATMEAEYQAKLDALQEKSTIKLTVNTDATNLATQIAKIDAALKGLGDVEVEVELDEAKLRAKRAELEAALTSSTFEVKYDVSDVGSLNRAKAKIQDMLAERRLVPLEVHPTEESMREALHKIESLKRQAEKDKVKFETEATGLGLMAARLAYASRTRVVPFYIRINEKSLLVAEGMLKSLSGYNTLSNLGRTLESVFTKFDTYALSAASLATALGSIVDTGAYVGTTLLSVGEGISQSIGLLAVAPAALLAVSAGLYVFSAGFNNFSNAFSDDAKKQAKAMRELPPNARAAVDALRGVQQQISTPVQNAFWVPMGDAIKRAKDHLLPQLTKGLEGLATGAGKFTSGVIDSFTEIAQNKQIEILFKNLTGFFELTGEAAKPFFDGFNQFGIRGSEFLPQFAGWLKDMSIQFDNWATKSAKNGDITRWIKEGVQSLKDMWNIGGSTIRMFQGLNEISLAAGGATLHEFSDEWSHIADVMNGEPFKSRMVSILKGARDGASQLNVGFKNLTTSLGENSEWLATVLTQLGGIGGKFLTDISFTVDSRAMQDGIRDALAGVSTMVGNLEPSFRSLGDIIGGIGTIAGAVFTGMGPLINTVMGIVGNLVSTLSGNLAGVSTSLIDGMNARITALATPLQIVGDLLNGILGFFNDMPTPIQNVVVAFGIFLLMRGQLSKLMTAIGDTAPFARMRGNWLQAESDAGRYGTAMQRQFTLGRGLIAEGRTGLSNLGQSWRDLGTRVSQAQTPMARTRVVASTAIGGIGKAAGGLVGFLGGPWGAAFAVAGIAASLFGEQQAQAKEDVDALKSSLEKTSGQVTQTTREIVATKFRQDDGWWNDLWRGSETAQKGIEKLGITSNEVTTLIANGGPKYDAYLEKLKLIKDNIAPPTTAGENYQQITMSMEELSTKTGFTVDELKRMDATSVSNVYNQIKDGGDKVAKAKDEVKALADATGLGEGTAGDLAVAIEGLGNKSSTAATQISSIKTMLDILKGGTLTQQDAARAFAVSWESALGTISDAATRTNEDGTKTKISLSNLIDGTTGKIKDLSGVGGQLYDATKKIADAQLTVAQSTYQSVLKQTGNTKLATEAAIQALNLTPGQLKTFADSVGVNVETAKKMLSGFFGETWEMKAMFSGNSKLFFEEKKKAEDAGKVFDQEAWEAILKANGQNVDDETKKSIEAGKAFARGDYTGVLKALPQDALAQIAKALGAGNGYKKGDYTGILKALNNTNPGIVAALLSIRGLTGANYQAAIKAFLDAVSEANTRAALDRIATAKRIATISVQYTDPGPAPGTGGRGVVHAQGMNGFVWDGKNGYPGGFLPHFPKVKAFANGGIENHVAQIARPTPGTVRIWGEEETGGEAYLPLSLAKRGRSTQILNQVATMFGYRLSRVNAYADGGVVGAGSRERSGSVAVNIDSYIQQSNNTADDVARAIMRRVKSRGVYSPMEGF